MGNIKKGEKNFGESEAYWGERWKLPFIMERSEWVWGDEINGLVAISSKMVKNPNLFRKGSRKWRLYYQYVCENTEEWKEATQKAHDMREELRVQFELKNSYGKLRNQLEEREEDKQWGERVESNRRTNVERNLPTIPEGAK